ncbi:head-tail connector protein [Rhizobium sp. VS19-DR104.2]|uniref:head-tail connector protein n=1 Tax=unclassified Rhizobium TaxID=2613769 RepID=UPI001CC56944|nr:MULTISPECIES: head-tail connector protein [unclassified Rhizobium]MBZ5760274.1 head-tail connector protein [Rhizobium sp. VS19-DR96]MBZ5766882.1 head-tail connector protein [Rhizobium sp. VS19-DR129.2]MBZ5773125.1 head-tail connector protein [Rhizobium sp. VS19-DRK62.2]MBZ5784109.1 head-tail connector protein [Rhizobium sp. VS19-DR121]MBZ5802469.1 head-tail connector protein [Rhizobium sp. VS19-DR181]
MIPELRVIDPPAPIVTIADIRRHIVELPQEDESYVEMLALAATSWIDGPTGWLGRALGIQTLELTTDGFWSPCGDAIPLPFPPVLEVVSVIYADPSGQMVTLASGAYRADVGGVRPTSGTWPDTADRSDAVRIRFKVGWAVFDKSDPPQLVSDVPAAIRVAILMLVGQWYRTREPVAIGATVEKLPFAVDSLLQPYRVYR